jgi:hypothetical protein
MRISGRRVGLPLVVLGAVVGIATLLPAGAGASAARRTGPLRLSSSSFRGHRGSTSTSAVRSALAGATVRAGTRLSPLSPASTERTQGDGIDLIAPANGSSWPDTAAISFSWSEDWYCPGCDGVEVLLVATDPSFNNIVTRQAGPCPASNAPSCPTSTSAGPFPAGTYYWAIGLQLGSNPVHVSDIWSFTVTASGTPPPPPPPTTPPPAGASSFTDATGDGKGAPDITGVTVSNDAAGQISVQINVPGATDIAADEAILVVLDTDQNPATGEPQGGGIEYIFVMVGATHAYGLVQWNGSQFVQVPASTASVKFSNGPVISINRSELGGAAVTGFNFWVRWAKGAPETGVFDDAPDTGSWNYKLTAGTPPPTSTPPGGTNTPPATTKTAAVASIRVLALPSAPTAGLVFRVLVPSVKLTTGANVHPDSARCTATLAGKVLRGTAAGGCTFSVPRTAGGKTLVVHVTIKYKGKSKTRTVSYKVRRQ